MLRLLLVNTGSNVLTMFVRLAIMFVMTPVLVHNLGRYDYGLWEMITGIIGYMGVLDLGTRPAVSRFAAKYRAEQDASSLQVLFSSVLVFFVCVACLMAIGLSLWGLYFPDAMAPEGEPSDRYTIVLLILAAQILITFPGYVAESYLEGFQKYLLKNNISIVKMVLTSSTILYFITPENGLILMVAVSAGAAVIKYLIYMWLLTRPAMGCIRYRLRYFSFSKLKEIIIFGSKSLVQGLSTRVENNTDALVIGFFLGPAMVPFYSIPANLVQHMRGIGMTLTHAFMPLFSDLSARSEDEKIRQVYTMASKYVVGILLPLAVGVVLVGGPFLGVWVGPEFQEKGELILLLLVLFTLTPMINPFVSRYLTGIGKHGIFAKVAPIAAVVNLGLSVLLVGPLGLWGVAFASLVPVFFVVPIYLVYACRQMGLTVRTYLMGSVLPIIIPTAVMGITVGLYRVKFGLAGYSDIFVAVLVGIIVYFSLFAVFVLNRHERRFIMQKLRKFKAG